MSVWRTAINALNLQTTPPLPENPRPIVVIGAGGIVNDAHLPAYRQAGFAVTGIFDLDEEQARKTAVSFKIPSIYPALETAVAESPTNAVFDVAVPAAALPKILPLLPNGAGVLIQKPMGASLAEARSILELCQQKELKAAVNFQLRYAPFVLAAHSLIEQGVIGELLDVEVRVNVFTPWHLWEYLEGVAYAELYYHSIHYLDYIRYCLGNPRGVFAKITDHPLAPRLNGVRSAFILDYGDALRATITANHFHQYGPTHQESYIKWEGSHGAIKAKMGLLMNYPAGVPDEFEYCILKEGHSPEWQSVDIPGSWFPEAFIGPMASIMRFAEGSSDRIPTAVSDAYQTMILVDAAHQSSQLGASPVEYT